jgi:putative peptidoglycan lipid II flippase
MVMFVLLARQARYRYRPRITPRDHLEKRIFTNAAIVMSTGLIARTRSIVINVIASTLGDGAITALAFATKLTEPLERASFTGTKMFMFSRAARLYAENRVQELGQIYTVAVRVSFMVLVPLLAWVTLNSQAIVTAMFGRGEFTLGMSTLVAAALAASAPAVLFSGVGQLLANAFYAMGRVKIPALVLPFGMLVFVVAASLLARPLGTQGLALATTISAISVFAVLVATLARTIPGLRWGHIALQLGGYCAFGGAVLAAVTVAARGLGGTPLATAIISLPAGTALYFAILYSAGDDALGMVTRFGRQWFMARGFTA